MENNLDRKWDLGGICILLINTWPGWQLVSKQLRPSPPVQEGVHKLTVVLAVTRLITDIVELP